MLLLHRRLLPVNRELRTKHRSIKMLTLQLINENPEDVIRRLAVKQFDGREPIMHIVDLDKKRRETQKKRDENASNLNKMAAQIGSLMKQGKKEEAQAAKEQVASLKAANKAIDDDLSAIEAEIKEILLSIPNVPYKGVPEGKSSDDNVVEKEGGIKPALPADAMPHWDLAKKYNIRTMTHLAHFRGKYQFAVANVLTADLAGFFAV